MKVVKNRLAELVAIKARAEDRTISNRDIARETGMTPNSVGTWMNNKVARYDAPVLATLCDWLGCDVSDLLILVEEDEGSRVTPQLLAEGLYPLSAASVESLTALSA